MQLYVRTGWQPSPLNYVSTTIQTVMMQSVVESTCSHLLALPGLAQQPPDITQPCIAYSVHVTI